MAKGEGFTPHDNPCCGIYAIAEATGLPFHTVFSAAAALLRKRSDWGGRTTTEDRERILAGLGSTCEPVPHMVGLTLLEAAWPWSDTKDKVYILEITGHLLCLKGGRLIDQYGKRHPTSYKRKFNRVQSAVLVEPVCSDTNDLI